MAALGHYQPFAQQCSLSHTVLTHRAPADIVNYRHFAFILHPNRWLCRLPQNTCFTLPLKASAPKTSRGAFGLRSLEKMFMQRDLNMKTMPFTVQAATEYIGPADPEDIEERRRRQENSSLPPQLRELTQEVPEPFNPLPWLAAFAILFITREVILFELLHWPKAAVVGLNALIGIALSLPGVSTLLESAAWVLAAVMTGTAWSFLFVKGAYAFIIERTPVQAIVKAIILASAVLGIGEATKMNAVSSQPYTLSMAALFGLGAVLGFFPSSVFVVLLFALVLFSSLVMKRDIVSALMPVAAVLAAVAEPWVRGVALAFFLALAVYENWKSPKEQIPLGNSLRSSGQPMIMFVLSLMVGMSAAAQWLYFRHLIWLAK